MICRKEIDRIFISFVEYLAQYWTGPCKCCGMFIITQACMDLEPQPVGLQRRGRGRVCGKCFRLWFRILARSEPEPDCSLSLGETSQLICMPQFSRERPHASLGTDLSGS